MDIKDLHTYLEKMEERAEKRFDNIDGKFEGIATRLNSIDKHLNRVDVTLAGQHIQLTEHIRRTNLLEKKVKDRTDENKAAIASIKHDTAPIHQHVNRMQWIPKILGFLLIVAGIVKFALTFT